MQDLLITNGKKKMDVDTWWLWIIVNKI